MPEKLKDLDINRIMEYHNCKYPMLMIDYVTEVEPGKHAREYKCFSYNEWYFPAHFEDDPMVPSSIMLEALSQMMLMTFLTLPQYKKKRTSCLKIDNVVFKKKIIPGNRLDIDVELIKSRGGVFFGHCEGFESEKIVCKADYTIGIPEIINSMIPLSAGGGQNGTSS